MPHEIVDFRLMRHVAISAEIIRMHQGGETLNTRHKKKVIVLMLLAALLLSLWSLVPSDSTSQAHVHAVGGFDAVTGISEEDGYAAYLNRHLAVDRPIETVRIEGEDFIETLGEGFEIVKQLEGLDGQAVVTPEAGTISWDVSIEQSGMYNIKIQIGRAHV